MINIVKEIFISRYAILYADKAPSKISLFMHCASFCMVSYLFLLNAFLVLSFFLNLEGYIFKHFIVINFVIFYVISYFSFFGKIDISESGNLINESRKKNMNTIFIVLSLMNLIALFFLLEATSLPLAVKTS